MAAVLALAGCSTLDTWVFGPVPEPDARPLTVAPLLASEPYPSVTTVPQRPQLSYTVEQEREIVDTLISDRENARYTGGVVRYRSGLGGSAPPAPPAGAARLRGEDVIGPEGAAAPPDLMSLGLEGGAPHAGARALPTEDARLDDGGLDDFVRGLVDETDVDPDLGTYAAVIDRRATSTTVPGRKGEESAFQRLFLWLAQQLGGGSEEATGEGGQTNGGGAAGDEPAIPPGAPATEPEGDKPAEGAVPKLKPDESADPPEPAPAKPEEAERAGGGAVPAGEPE